MWTWKYEDKESFYEVVKKNRSIAYTLPCRVDQREVLPSETCEPIEPIGMTSDKEQINCRLSARTIQCQYQASLHEVVQKGMQGENSHRGSSMHTMYKDVEVAIKRFLTTLGQILDSDNLI